MFDAIRMTTTSSWVAEQTVFRGLRDSPPMTPIRHARKDPRKTESYNYRGHSIDIDFQKLNAGRIRCTYFIDASYCFQSEMGADLLEATRTRAVALAHASIDALDCQCPNPAEGAARESRAGAAPP